MIVSDTGPLIAFLQIDHLDLLQQVLGTLIIPDAVYDEFVSRDQGARVAKLDQNPWVQRKSVTNREALSFLSPQLHVGEQEAIVLAQELGTELLIDERRGRKIARDLGLQVFGSLRILVEAKRQGFIASVKPLLEAMLAARYWIDQELVALVLQEVGEAER
jgi:predicted nucleic acid-binding protein